nr:PA1571 family protein [uncultured Pseudomonas sp.]
MSLHEQTREPRVIPMHAHRAVGGAVIDEHGREIPITEQMIQNACRELENSRSNLAKHG